jgi:1-acyl-sn-glycerol-3-phosphate acyltransferase
VDAARWVDGVEVAAPGVASPFALRAVRTVLLPLVRVLHRPTLEGLEHLPDGPFLLVANHSGCSGIAEISSFVARYVERFGGTKRLAGFAHPISFAVWPLTWLMRQIGGIPSTYRAAEAALAAGVPILLFPGGDHDALRPVWQASCVDFAGRVGFLRIARQARVPIVPLGIQGSHFTAPPLLRARSLSYVALWPRLFGIKRYSITLLGVLGAVAMALWVPLAWPWRLLLAWAWMASPLSLLPWVPWRVRMRIGRPLTPEALFADDDLPRALAVVERAVEDLVRAET